MNEDLNVSSPNKSEVITNFYVHPQNGSDNNIGTLSHPFKTLHYASQVASKVNNGNESVNVHLLQGDYSNHTTNLYFTQYNYLAIHGNNQTLPMGIGTHRGGRIFLYDIALTRIQANQHGYVYANNLTLNGGSEIVCAVQLNGGFITLQGSLVINGSYSDAIFSVWDCSKLELYVTSYTGNATGKKYRVFYNSGIWNQNKVTLVGSTNGEAGNNGYYRE